MYNADLNRRFLHPEIPRWWTYTGSSYNFVTENNIKMVLAAGAMFYIWVAAEIATISVSVAKLLVLPVSVTVSTSGLHWIVLSSRTMSMVVEVDRACPATLPQPLRSPWYYFLSQSYNYFRYTSAILEFLREGNVGQSRRIHQSRP